MRRVLTVCVVFWAVWVAAPTAQIQCAGDDCPGVHEQLGPAAKKIEQEKSLFVSALRRVIEAVDGAFGDEGPVLSSSIEEMRDALGRWDKAIQTYRAVLLDAAAELPDAHVALAAIFLDRGKADAGLKEASAASRLDPWREDAYVLQALAHDLAGRPADAARALAKALRVTSGTATAYALAQRLMAAGDEDGATTALRRFYAAVENAPPRPAEKVSDVMRFVRAGLLRQSAGIAPMFPPAAYSTGFTLLAHNDFDRAVDALKTAAAHDPLTADSTSRDEDMSLGASALRRGELRVALVHFQKAVEKSPDRSEARRLLGLAYRADEQYESSIEQLTAATALNPADDRSRVTLAEVLVAAGRLGDAERCLSDTIETLPRSGRAHYQLAMLYKGLARSREALRELESAAALEPIIGQDHLFDVLGTVYASDTDLERALRAYRRRIDANPNNSDAHRKLGQIYLEQTRNDEALAELVAALLLDPSNAEAHAVRAQLHLRTGGYANAETSARRALMLNPAHMAARYALGASLMRLGRTEEGARELDEFQRLQTDALARTNREWEVKLILQAAQASLDHGDPDRAATLLQEAVSLEPDAATYVSLGLVLTRAGRVVDAIAALQQAARRGAGAEVHRHLADAYARLERWPESQAEAALYNRAKEERLRGAGRGR